MIKHRRRASDVGRVPHDIQRAMVVLVDVVGKVLVSQVGDLVVVDDEPHAGTSSWVMTSSIVAMSGPRRSAMWSIDRSSMSMPMASRLSSLAQRFPHSGDPFLISGKILGEEQSALQQLSQAVFYFLAGKNGEQAGKRCHRLFGRIQEKFLEDLLAQGFSFPLIHQGCHGADTSFHGKIIEQAAAEAVDGGNLLNALRGNFHAEPGLIHKCLAHPMG